MAPPGTRKQVQEMNIDGFLLVQRKKKKVIQSLKSEIKTEIKTENSASGSSRPGLRSKKRKVEQNQTEVTIFVHFRSISRASSVTNQSLEERSMTVTETRTEGQEPIKGRKISNHFFCLHFFRKMRLLFIFSA